MLAEIDLVRDSPLIGLAAFGLYFGAVFLVGAVDNKQRVDQPLFQVALMQAVFVPLVAWMTIWCYQHPERLAVTPDAWRYDMRLYWPFFTLVDVVLMAWFIHSRWWNWGAKAKRLMVRANKLL